MNARWINAALTAGGTLTIRQVLPRKTILQAEMSWPDEDSIPIRGAVSLGASEAFVSLEMALRKDGEARRGER